MQIQTLPQKGSLLDDLAVVSSGMTDYIDTENDAVLATTVTRMNKAPSFWRKMFPNAYNREQDKIGLDMLRTAYRDRRAFLDGFVAIQLEIARQRGDALVVGVGTDLQTKLAGFASEKLRELEKIVIATKEDFLALAFEHRQKIEQYRDVPEIYEPALQDCIHEIRAVLSCIQSLRENFTAALQAKVAGKGR